MYEEAGIQTFNVDVNAMFSEMENVYPGFSKALFTSTVMETLSALQELVKNVENTEAFERWLSVVFSDYPPTADIAKAISSKLSHIYIKLSQIVADKLRGIHVYVVGYTSEGLLLVSKEGYPADHLQTLLGGLL